MHWYAGRSPHLTQPGSLGIAQPGSLRIAQPGAGATHSEGAEGGRVVRADLTMLLLPHRRLAPAGRDSLSVAPGTPALT